MLATLLSSSCLLLFKKQPFAVQITFSPSKLPHCLGTLDPHLIHGSSGPPESTPQTASRSV